MTHKKPAECDPLGHIVYFHPKIATQRGEEMGTWPAIVTAVEPDGKTCHLHVFSPGRAVPDVRTAKWAAAPEPDHWTWPAASQFDNMAEQIFGTLAAEFDKLRDDMQDRLGAYGARLAALEDAWPLTTLTAPVTPAEPEQPAAAAAAADEELKGGRKK